MNTNADSSDPKLSRRSVVAAGSGLLTTGLAGCLGSGGGAGSGSDGSNTDSNDAYGGSESEDGPVAVASFLSFYDFACEVATDTLVTLKNLTPMGLHGHGWEPDASVTRDIIEADAFVHVGKDFQPWADRAIQTLKDDDVDTQFINVREGVELVELAASLDRDKEGVGEGHGKDLHFWPDPRRVKTVVDNITEGLVELAPAYEKTFRDNVNAYKTGALDHIDQDYQDIFDWALRKVIQLAAHNALQYIDVRYGVKMRPLVANLAASDDVKPSDIIEARRVIEDNDTRYTGAGVFETRRPAKQLIAETPAEACFLATPYTGVREDWVADDWGYEEIADNINMSTFEVVLGNKSPEGVGGDS